MANTEDGIIVKKVVMGFVVKTYRMLPEPIGTITCESQEFIASGDVTWKDEFGDEIEEIFGDQVKDCHMLMVQPTD